MPGLERLTKISERNLGRIKKLKATGYEPNDHIIGLALDALENERQHERREEGRKGP